MHMMTLIKNTGNGNIEVSEVNNPDYPGIAIDIEGKQVARIELNKETGQFQLYTWEDSAEQDDDYHTKLVYDAPPYGNSPYYKQIYQDILDVMSEEDEDVSEPRSLTNEQIKMMIHNIAASTDYSKYENRIRDLLARYRN